MATRTKTNIRRKYLNSSQFIPSTGEINNLPSMTLPNQAPSMRDLLQRHALGIKDNVAYKGNYTGDLPDLRGIEPHDLSTMIYENQQKLNELEEIKNQQSVQLRQAQYEAKRKSDLQLLKQLQAENPKQTE